MEQVLFKGLEIQSQINEQIEYLRSTDWCVVKCYDLGLKIAEVYPTINEMRQRARDRINELEKELSTV